MEGFKNTTKMKYMTEGGTFNESGRRATMGEIAAEDRRMANAAPKKAIGPSSVAVSKVLAGMTKKATGGSVSGTSTAATTAANPKAGLRTISQFNADNAAKHAAMRQRIADNKTNLGKTDVGRRILAQEKKNEPVVAAERAKQRAARDANLGKTFVGRQVLAQRKSADDLAKGITPPSKKYTPERMAEIKAKAKSQLDRYAAELNAKGRSAQSSAAATTGGVTKKATGGSVSDKPSSGPFVPGRSPRGSGPNDGGLDRAPSSVGGVRSPKRTLNQRIEDNMAKTTALKQRIADIKSKIPVRPKTTTPVTPKPPKNVTPVMPVEPKPPQGFTVYDKPITDGGMVRRPADPKRGVYSPERVAEANAILDAPRTSQPPRERSFEKIMAKGGSAKKGVPAYSGKPMIGRKAGSFAVMPKGKC